MYLKQITFSWPPFSNLHFVDPFLPNLVKMSKVTGSWKSNGYDSINKSSISNKQYSLKLPGWILITNQSTFFMSNQQIWINNLFPLHTQGHNKNKICLVLNKCINQYLMISPPNQVINHPGSFPWHTPKTNLWTFLTNEMIQIKDLPSRIFSLA